MNEKSCGRVATRDPTRRSCPSVATGSCRERALPRIAGEIETRSIVLLLTASGQKKIHDIPVGPCIPLSHAVLVWLTAIKALRTDRWHT